MGVQPKTAVGCRMNQTKFKKLVHYVCWKCSSDPARLGSTKLNKVLWIAEIKNYYESGKSITGARYVRRQYGPVPAAILPILEELEREGTLTPEKSTFGGYTQRRFIVHRDADVDFLSAEERARVDEIIEFVCDRHTAKSISDATHDEIWQLAADGEEIPHFTIFSRAAEITEEDREWARHQLEAA